MFNTASYIKIVLDVYSFVLYIHLSSLFLYLIQNDVEHPFFGSTSTVTAGWTPLPLPCPASACGTHSSSTALSVEHVHPRNSRGEITLISRDLACQHALDHPRNLATPKPKPTAERTAPMPYLRVSLFATSIVVRMFWISFEEVFFAASIVIFMICISFE